MKTFEFQTQLWLPKPPSEVFPFFAEAFNLEQITPPFLRFYVLSAGPIAMRNGTEIDYRLKIHGVPVRWRSRITEWNPPLRFVDEQVRGPYRLWRHTHTFEEDNGGTLCGDHVRYASLGGSLINKLFVEREIKGIFAYRSERLRTIFKAD